MSGIGKWLLGAALGLLGLIGLVIASGATDRVFYWTGLVLFLFSVVFIYGMINRYAGGRRGE